MRMFVGHRPNLSILYTVAEHILKGLFLLFLYNDESKFLLVELTGKLPRYLPLEILPGAVTFVCCNSWFRWGRGEGGTTAMIASLWQPEG